MFGLLVLMVNGLSDITPHVFDQVGRMVCCKLHLNQLWKALYAAARFACSSFLDIFGVTCRGYHTPSGRPVALQTLGL